jgi:hypothetical protein
MFLIDSRGIRPVCISCRRLGPYQEEQPGVFICDGLRAGGGGPSSGVGRECPGVTGPSAETVAYWMRLRTMPAAREPGSIGESNTWAENPVSKWAENPVRA